MKSSGNMLDKLTVILTKISSYYFGEKHGVLWEQEQAWARSSTDTWRQVGLGVTSGTS